VREGRRRGAPPALPQLVGGAPIEDPAAEGVGHLVGGGRHKSVLQKTPPQCPPTTRRTGGTPSSCKGKYDTSTTVLYCTALHQVPTASSAGCDWPCKAHTCTGSSTCGLPGTLVRHSKVPYVIPVYLMSWGIPVYLVPWYSTVRYRGDIPGIPGTLVQYRKVPWGYTRPVPARGRPHGTCCTATRPRGIPDPR